LLGITSALPGIRDRRLPGGTFFVTVRGCDYRGRNGALNK
jgi:hypothetical protein